MVVLKRYLCLTGSFDSSQSCISSKLWRRCLRLQVCLPLRYYLISPHGLALYTLPLHMKELSEPASL